MLLLYAVVVAVVFVAVVVVIFNINLTFMQLISSIITNHDSAATGLILEDVFSVDAVVVVSRATRC